MVHLEGRGPEGKSLDSSLHSKGMNLLKLMSHVFATL